MAHEKTYTYKSDDITVTYALKRCIHAAECVHGLPSVFDPNAKPWTQPGNATADAVAEVIHKCPTGALQYERHDGGPAEAIPDANTIEVVADGPLYVRGDITIQTADGTEVLKDTRIALCRCGASKNKPFCDNSHNAAGFTDAGAMGTTGLKADPDASPSVMVTLAENGPLLFKGSLTLNRIVIFVEIVN